jgi:hypothetical protein
MICPFACPLAWSPYGGYPCTDRCSRVAVPANDCPPVNPCCHVLPPGGLVHQLPVHLDAVWQGRGVVACPLADPFASPCASARPLTCCTAVPAKERQKEQPCGAGGGL